MTIHRTITLLSLILIGIGTALILVFHSQPHLLSHPPEDQLQSQQHNPPLYGTPRRIAIPSLSLALPVKDGTYNPQDQTWTLDEESAFFGVSTAHPNPSSGTTFIYGHNSEKIFGKLEKINQGMEVVVSTDTDYGFTYKLISEKEVSPNDMGIFQPIGKPQLVLQTCSGFWNEKRHLFFFELQTFNKTSE